MTPADSTRWLVWCSKLQAIAQTGLTFAQDRCDRERYEELRSIAAEMLAQASNVDAPRIADFLAKDNGYATPKVDVRGVIFREGKILLVRERNDGGWTLPGGWADVHESPAENVVREIREEAGFETRAIKLLAVFDRSKHPHEPAFPFHVYKFFFRCEIIGGTATTSSETDEVEFFHESEIPTLSQTRVTAAQIRCMFEHWRTADRPTDFDVVAAR